MKVIENLIYQLLSVFASSRLLGRELAEFQISGSPMCLVLGLLGGGWVGRARGARPNTGRSFQVNDYFIPGNTEGSPWHQLITLIDEPMHKLCMCRKSRL